MAVPDPPTPIASRAGMAALARAPRRAERAKRRSERMRSARFRSALPRAPITNPSWTLMVIQAWSAPERSQASVSWGTTADAENQSPMARVSARARSPTCCHLPLGAVSGAGARC